MNRLLSVLGCSLFLVPIAGGQEVPFQDYDPPSTLVVPGQEVTRAIAGKERHFSAEELREQLPGVGRATVFRTLKMLQECNLVSTIADAKGTSRFEVDLERPHHDHLICAKCGLILEFEDEQIEQLQDEIAKRLGGFKVVRHRHELYALCPKEQGIADGSCPND